ncbi:lipopolysaccharide heptosyltransferase I [Geomonas azotofigens]|uniref:lipopolysaccharide heptosyltransferase I n=1 Tax=Geomonas azotofigens TaxID=2843196 RepID=UPI001C117AB7|nr:lipopolysaccharide heptosyltransferase I [Geomonas azotofigens]MBU5615095.1 lipopolysaccharide heptosyltransferase I [Geomonas azotofigens]
MRVLIIKPSSLGDVIQTLPVLDFLHQAVPGIEVDWVVEENLEDLLAGHPQVSRVHPVPAALWRKHRFSAKTWRGVSALRKTLCERAYDLVFDLQGDLISGVISRYSGCADRLGFERDAVVEPLNTWCNTRLIPVRRQEYHNIDRFLRLVSIPFAKDFRTMELPGHLVSSPEDEANAEALLATLADGLVFLFHHGTANPTEAWSEKGWTGLGREVLERFHDATILLPWENEAERQAAFSIASAIGQGCRVLDRLSLKGMAALLKKVDLVVGGDAGLVQMAAVLGTPTVSFYRGTQAKRSAPRGDAHVALQSPMHCAGCLRAHCDKDAKCRDSIKVEAMLAAVTRLLALPGNM